MDVIIGLENAIMAALFIGTVTIPEFQQNASAKETNPSNIINIKFDLFISNFLKSVFMFFAQIGIDDNATNVDFMNISSMIAKNPFKTRCLTSIIHSMLIQAPER